MQLVAGNKMALAALLVLALVTGHLASASETKLDQSTESGSSNNNRYISVPASFVRFLFYNARPNLAERQANLMGYKRSSGALDALSGVTLGKRSPASDYLNLEPFLGRHYGLRSAGLRSFDSLRWAPYELFESNSASPSDSS